MSSVQEEVVNGEGELRTKSGTKLVPRPCPGFVWQNMHWTCVYWTTTGADDLLGSINHTLDNETAVLVLSSFCYLEGFQCVCKFESMRQ